MGMKKHNHPFLRGVSPLVLALAVAGCASFDDKLSDEDKLFKSCGGIVEFTRTSTILEVQVRFVKVAQQTLDEVGAKLLPGRPAGHRYDLVDFEAVSADEFERCLVARRDLLRNDAPRVLTHSDDEAVCKSVTEYIYPTDYDVQMGEIVGSVSNETARQTGIATVEPQSFTMREVGTILVVTPSLEEGEDAVDIKVNAQIVGEPTWKNYAMQLPSPNGGTYTLMVEQPFFPVRATDTTLRVALGETRLLSARVSADNADETELVFLRVRRLDTPGRGGQPVQK